MEKLSHNLHKKLQEMCDCYMNTDFKAELEAMAGKTGENLEEEATKFLALAILLAVSEKAGKLSIKMKKEEVKVGLAAEEKISLPSPALEIAVEIFRIMRAITHIEEDKGNLPISLGLRNSSVEVQVKLKRDAEKGKESLKLKFPKL